MAKRRVEMAVVIPVESKREISERKQRKWVNCFLCSAICPEKISPRTARMVAILDDFFKYSSIHGVRYIGKGTLGPWDNILWLILVTICAGVTIYFSKATLDRYRQTPTEIVVANSALPLSSFPFPAVTVCPAQNMDTFLAERILTEMILNTSSSNFSDWTFDVANGNTSLNVSNFSYFPLSDIINILIDSEIPRSGARDRILRRLRGVQHLLPLLSELNITQFMLQTLPPCRKLFRGCLWSGEPYDCCDLFELQRTEIGFCYSFNSLTSEARRNNCEEDPDQADSDVRNDNCTLRRTASAGPGSALKMYLRVPADVTQPETSIAQVTVGSPRDLPEPLAGAVVPAMNGVTLQAPVSYQYTASSSALRSLPESQRACLLASERRLRVTRFYSRRSCIFECRQEYMKRMCGCLPYPYSTTGLAAECRLHEYFCVARVSGFLQFFTPPVDVPGFSDNEYHYALNCSHCWRTCQAASYRMSVRLGSETSVFDNVCVDVFFQGLNSAVLYRHKVVFTLDKLLVSLGGVANLFLGISYLSLLEILVVIVKLCAALWQTNFFQNIP